ncbi:hypothetical protein FRC10_008931 [Ceratobasidium sp. 414]|nr:hypothetical protein FRC10_008931 [Ceratobasidium sp. 414]
MSLPGATVDGPNAEAWAKRLAKGIRSIRVRNASKSEVVLKFTRVEGKAQGTEGCCLYFQGHGIYPPGRVNRYLTAQNSVNEGENWDGLDAKVRRGHAKAAGFDQSPRMENSKSSFKFSWFHKLKCAQVATDFCHSGNCFALQFVLCIEGDTAEWKEVAGWKESSSGPCAPTTLTKPRDKMLALPGLLRVFRSEVNESLDAAKQKGAIEIGETQTPQVLS